MPAPGQPFACFLREFEFPRKQLYIQGMSIDWKLLFHQLFALEIKKEYVLDAPESEREDIYTRLLNACVHYTPASFNDVVAQAMAATSPEHADEIRQGVYEHPIGRALIHDFDLGRCINAETRELAGVDEYLSSIENCCGRAIDAEENFFASVEGKNVATAFAFDGASNEQQVALVMVPGYAAHTIAHAIFEEIVADANEVWGRPATRPLLKADGIDLEFEDHATFYARGVGERPAFDILRPAGTELGNTTGRNEETTEKIAEWITSLPKKYSQSKFIFLGYSKGAPIVLDLANRHPGLSKRTLGYVTHAGVLQGAHAARAFLEQADKVLRDVPMGDFVARLREEDPAQLAQVISPLFSQLDLSWLSVPRIRELFETLGIDISEYERQSERFLGGREVRELLDGARDLAPKERIRWSLVHLNDDSFADKTYVFNLSGLAQVRDFVRPVELSRGGEIGPSLLAPTFNRDGEIAWDKLSIDAIVLYFTSLAGFKNSPGGLFDAQVDLSSSKTMLLDTRPLDATLTTGELDALWSDTQVREQVEKGGVTSREAFATTPRSELVPMAQRKNIDAIDLGEFRGHHWSLFVQALRPPASVSETHAVWNFPRKAYIRALLQVLALRNLIDANEGGAR